VKAIHLTQEALEILGFFASVAEWRQHTAANLPTHTAHEKRSRSKPDWRQNMLGLIARWTHNALLASVGLLTIALVIWAA
jgi:hypothetical protein